VEVGDMTASTTDNGRLSPSKPLCSATTPPPLAPYFLPPIAVIHCKDPETAHGTLFTYETASPGGGAQFLISVHLCRPLC
jgi:hypothetical protein